MADGQTELTILLPRRGFAAGWQRLLHDRTADQIAAAVGQLAHVNATVVPYQLTGGWLSKPARVAPTDQSEAGQASPRPTRAARAADRAADREAAARAAVRPRARSASGAGGRSPIGEAQWRTRVRVAGRVKSVRVQPRAGTSNLECVLADDSGKLLLVFQGRRRIPGIQPGARLVVEGMVGDWARRQAILNPDYELIAGPEAGRASRPDRSPRSPDPGSARPRPPACFLAPDPICRYLLPPLPGSARRDGAPRRSADTAVASQGDGVLDVCGGPRPQEADWSTISDQDDSDHAVHRREPHR